MSWGSARPLDTWKTAEQFAFFREVWNRLKFGSFTWNPPSVGAATSVDTTLATTDAPQVKGLRVGMSITVSAPSGIDAGISWGAHCLTDDTLTVRLTNVTAAPINPTSGTWSFHGVVI